MGWGATAGGVGRARAAARPASTFSALRLLVPLPARSAPQELQRNLTPPSNVGTSDKPTWRCQQIPLIGALGIQVICYPRRAFQERLINDRKDDQPLEAGEGGDSTDYLAKGSRATGNLRSER